MQPYAIGLDIGITSVGWATLALDAKENPCGIISMGCRIFDAAEVPKTGASLAAPRREARSTRRRLRRHRHRNERIKYLLTNTIITKDELDTLFSGQLEDIYTLRVRALDELVTNTELARILIHIAQRRGFKSNRKGEASGEDGKALKAVSDNIDRMNANSYRTPAEMFLKDEVFAEHKRNVGGDYLTTVTRAMVEDEVHKIFAAQRKYGSKYATEKIENEYTEILLSQRSFDEGPGGNSPYSGSQIDRMIGKSSLGSEEQRSAKAAYSFEYFSLLEKVNHMRIVDSKESVPLTEEQRDAIIKLAHESENITYARLRKLLEIPENKRFNFVRYESEDYTEAEKKEKLVHLKAYHQIRRAFESVEPKSFEKVSKDTLDSIGTILTKYKNGTRIEAELAALGFEDKFIFKLEELSFTKFGHISLKECRSIIPFLEQGLDYDKACTAAGIDFRAHNGGERRKYLKYEGKDFEDITNPVVRRAISQTIKVVNAIIRKQDASPVYINIELAREMSKNFADRNKMRKDNESNASANEKLINEIKETFGITSPSGLDLVKYRLYKEQDCICAYSLRHIACDRLFEPNYVEVDHIVPYSISFDDSRKNKVLVLTEENRKKGNRLPLQYLTGERREQFIVYTKQNVKDYRKRQLLLKESYDEEGFKERNLTDTKYIASFMQNYLRDKLAFAPSVTGKKKRVTAVNGAVTAYMRKRWGITKIREDGDLHHAVDAVVIACVTDGMIQRVSKYSRWKECRYSDTDTGSVLVDDTTGEVLTQFPYPWQWFRKELEARLAADPAKIVTELKIPFYMDEEAPEVKPIFVSRMPRHKVTGPAHKETVRSSRALDEGFTVIKKPITELKFDKGELTNYYYRGDDRILYEALISQIEKFNGDVKAAFAEPFHKPKKDGTPGPVVRKVLIKEPATMAVPVYGGSAVAENDTMVRIDIFKVEGEGYYMVPIYVADTLKPVLPNKAVTQRKPYSEWKEMKEENFVFSLYPNDLVKPVHKTGIIMTKINKESTLPDTKDCNDRLLYYSKASISTGAIKLVTDDKSYEIPSLGIKSLVSLTKYTVDVLGEYHEVKKETRQTFR